MAGEAASYALLGGRLLAELGGFDLSLSGRSGHAVGQDSGGRWIQGDVFARAGRRLGSAWVRLGAGGFGLHYVEPFEYDAAGAELRPELSFSAGRIAWVVSPRITAGRWSTETLEGDLWMAGGSVEAQRSFGPVAASTRLELLDVENGATTGAFLRGGLGAIYARQRWALGIDVQAQQTPLETEVGGVVVATGFPTSGLALRLEAGRFLRDPLFGAASSLGLSASLSIRPVRLTAPGPAPIAAVGEKRSDGRIVRFTIRAPEAERVEISGDFTAWEPVPMERRGEQWSTAVLLGPGLHHFGFLVDGQWAIPPDAPGRVDDGWGRINASVVVEP